VVQAKAPAHLLEGSWPTEALVAQIAVSKHSVHMPLNRQAVVKARHGVPIDRSVLADWMGRAGGRMLEFILAVPVRRYGELVETFRALSFDEDGLAEARFAGHRLIVAHDPLRAAEQGEKRRLRIAELEALADKMVGKLAYMLKRHEGFRVSGAYAAQLGARSPSTSR